MSVSSKTCIETCLKVYACDLKRETVDDLSDNITNDGSMTDELRKILQAYKETIPVTKGSSAIKKKKTKRYSGYHLFMKERRAEIKDEFPEKKPQELIGLVASSWKDLSKDEQNEFKRRASLKKIEDTTEQSI